MSQYFGNKKIGNIIELKQEDLNHIKNVMRMKEKDNVLITFENTRYLCELDKNYNGVIIEMLETKKIENEIIFYIPVTVEDKMDLVLQKGTELGVTSFIPTEYEHSKFRIKNDQKEKKVSRWNKIVKSASEQCHRFDIPVVENIINYKEIRRFEGVNILCSLDKENVKPIKEVLTTKNVYDTIIVLYGPEGGFSKEEEKYFCSLGFEKTSLCDTVLRTETVIIFVSSIIKYLKSGV